MATRGRGAPGHHPGGHHHQQHTSPQQSQSPSSAYRAVLDCRVLGPGVCQLRLWPLDGIRVGIVTAQLGLHTRGFYEGFDRGALDALRLMGRRCRCVDCAVEVEKLAEYYSGAADRRAS